MYSTPLNGRTVIDDSNAHLYASTVPNGCAKGYHARDYSLHPEGSFAAPFPMPSVPRGEWRDRIEEIDKSGSSLRKLAEQAGMKPKNQQQTNYCWINAPVAGSELVRVYSGYPYVELSPASCGAKIKNFRNVGGWGSEGLKYIVEHGVTPASIWPCNAIDRKYDTPASDAERAKYRVTEWWELQERNFDQLMTCLLLGCPVAIGLNWWGHEVLAVGAVALDGGKFGVEVMNSWGDNWEDHGYGILSESKATPDDAVAPRVMLGTA